MVHFAILSGTVGGKRFLRIFLSPRFFDLCTNLNYLAGKSMETCWLPSSTAYWGQPSQNRPLSPHGTPCLILFVLWLFPILFDWPPPFILQHYIDWGHLGGLSLTISNMFTEIFMGKGFSQNLQTVFISEMTFLWPGSQSSFIDFLWMKFIILATSRVHLADCDPIPSQQSESALSWRCLWWCLKVFPTGAGLLTMEKWLDWRYSGLEPNQDHSHGRDWATSRPPKWV